MLIREIAVLGQDPELPRSKPLRGRVSLARNGGLYLGIHSALPRFAVHDHLAVRVVRQVDVYDGVTDSGPSAGRGSASGEGRRKDGRRQHHASTISSGGFVSQRPRVKSGKAAGSLPLATEISDSSHTALSAAASYTFMSVGRPSRRHLMSR